MKPALGYEMTNHLDTWLSLPSGRQLKLAEQAIINKHLDLSFGHHLLKAGSLASDLNTSECRINHQVNLQATFDDMAGVVAELDELPLASNSIDVVLAAHVVEFSADPHQLLRELHRCITPNGKLILTVFNPYSLLLFNKLWPFKFKSDLTQARLFRISRIKDWLQLLGFELLSVEYDVYSSLLKKEMNKPSWISNRLKKWFPSRGSVCVLVARKREWPLTPIRPRLRYKPAFSPAIRSASANRLRK